MSEYLKLKKVKEDWNLSFSLIESIRHIRNIDISNPETANQATLAKSFLNHEINSLGEKLSSEHIERAIGKDATLYAYQMMNDWGEDYDSSPFTQAYIYILNSKNKDKAGDKRDDLMRARDIIIQIEEKLENKEIRDSAYNKGYNNAIVDVLSLLNKKKGDTLTDHVITNIRSLKIPISL